jgi:N-acetylglucosaminyl-diphospho-decaprenol L-rhamnosyltransferase
MRPPVPPAEPPLIDAYIIHWRAPEWCVHAAASLLASEDVRIRCRVVDNGESGGPALAAALDPRVEVISTSENLGYTGAANVGLARALAEQTAAEFVVVAAHDARVQPDALGAMSSVARSDPRIGIVAPVLTEPAVEAGGWWRDWRAKATATWSSSTAFEERDWMSGTLLMIRPECVTDIGGFDETFGSYVEDVDLCLRARDAGWRVGIATAARAAGVGSASSNVTVMVDVNSVLLAVKRRGLKATPGILLRYGYWVLRGIAAGLAPRRTRARRRASLVHAKDHARAIARIARQWRLVRQIARDPNGGERRFD